MDFILFWNATANRASLRRHGCLQILLHHLSSASLTVVSNACGTLWNLSARCKEDQATLRDLGAIPMLRSLVHSRHKMIAMGSSAALKNLDSSATLGASMVSSNLVPCKLDSSNLKQSNFSWNVSFHERHSYFWLVVEWKLCFNFCCVDVLTGTNSYRTTRLALRDHRAIRHCRHANRRLWNRKSTRRWRKCVRT